MSDVPFELAHMNVLRMIRRCAMADHRSARGKKLLELNHCRFAVGQRHNATETLRSRQYTFADAYERNKLGIDDVLHAVSELTGLMVARCTSRWFILVQIPPCRSLIGILIVRRGEILANRKKLRDDTISALPFPMITGMMGSSSDAFFVRLVDNVFMVIFKMLLRMGHRNSFCSLADF